MLRLPTPFLPGFEEPAVLDGNTRWYVFAGHELLVQTADERAEAYVPQAATPPLATAPLGRLYLGRYGDRHCVAVAVGESTPVPPGMRFQGLRKLWGRLDEADMGLAGKALQLLDWDRCHRYCGRCGERTARRDTERARHCPACGLSHYPRLAPAMMVRINRGDEILLARSPRFAPGMYSVLAGFVDPGETIEQTIHREVMEEVGLRVDNLRYFTSQSWPVPHSLMVAFSAGYVGGEIVLEDPEIEDAGWYRRDNLPGLPITMSIARALIDDWLIAGSKKRKTEKEN